MARRTVPSWAASGWRRARGRGRGADGDPWWHRPALLAAGPAGFATVLALVGVSARELWGDEYATWYAATLSPGDLRRLLSHVDAVLAPYYLFMHMWIAVLGDSPLALRLPSVLAVGTAAGLVTLIGRRLGGPLTGLVAGFLFGAIPAVSRYGQEARPYAPAIMATALATLLLLRAVAQPRWSRWLGYSVGLALAGWIHIVTVTLAAAHAPAVRRAPRVAAGPSVRRWSVSLLVAALLVMPLAVVGARQSEAVAWVPRDRAAVATLPTRLFASSTVATCTVVLSTLAPLTLRGERRGSLPVLAAWAAVPPMLCFLIYPVWHVFLYRYLLFTLPAWAILAAAGAVGLGRLVPASLGSALPIPDGLREDPPARGHPALVSARVTVALGLFAGLLWAGLPDQVVVRRSPVAGEPDFRAAARAVAARTRPGDGIAYGGSYRNGRIALAYELRSSPRPADVFVKITPQAAGSFQAIECDQPERCLGPTGRVWLVTSTGSPDPFAELSPPIADVLRREFTVSDTRWWTGVRLVLLTRSDRPTG